jgi:hypothetical protein
VKGGGGGRGRERERERSIVKRQPYEWKIVTVYTAITLTIILIILYSYINALYENVC